MKAKSWPFRTSTTADRQYGIGRKHTNQPVAIPSVWQYLDLARTHPGTYVTELIDRVVRESLVLHRCRWGSNSPVGFNPHGRRALGRRLQPASRRVPSKTVNTLPQGSENARPRMRKMGTQGALVHCTQSMQVHTIVHVLNMHTDIAKHPKCRAE